MDLWHSKIWISLHYEPVRHTYMTVWLPVQPNEHFSAFKQLLNCILMSCDSREATLLKHGRHPGLKNSFSRWSSDFFFFFFFLPPAQNFLNSSSCPEIQGFLYLKETGRKSWKKLYMFLRRSGLYCSTKGMSKASFSLNLF